MTAIRFFGAGAPLVVGAMVGGMKVTDVYSQQQSGMNVRSFMGIRISQEKREKKKANIVRK